MAMKFYTLEEMTDKHIGKRGTPERESFEAEVEAALIGASIKEARKSMNLTQKELGERVGVQTAQISKIAWMIILLSIYLMVSKIIPNFADTKQLTNANSLTNIRNTFFSFIPTIMSLFTFMLSIKGDMQKSKLSPRLLW